jgi:hypothetical protein
VVFAFIYMLTETDTEARTKVLKNGAVYDLDKKRIVANPGGGTTAITSETSSAFHARRQELKRERIMVGAAKVLETLGDWEAPTDMDVVEAIGEAVMENAIDPKSKKQIDAANFILRESGLSMANSQRENEPPPAGAISASVDTMRQLLDMIEQRQAAAVDRARAIDAEATDTRSE